MLIAPSAPARAAAGVTAAAPPATAPARACPRPWLHRRGTRARRLAVRRRAACLRARARAAAPPTTGTAPLAVGLVDDTFGFNPLEVGARMDRLARSGTRWLREALPWNRIEPADGRFAFARYDQAFTAAARRGLRIVPLLYDTPPWAGRAWNTIPEDPGAFAEYTAKVVARYGPGGSFWAAHPELDGALAPQWFEILNEPYFGFFSEGGVDPGRYARLFKAAVAAGRAANPRARYLLQVDGDIRHEGRWTPWIDLLFDAVPDLGPFVDGAAPHLYTSAPLDHWTPGREGANEQFRRIDAQRERLAAHGRPDVPFWITEIGWSTCGAPAEWCKSEEEQAARITRLVQLLRSDYRGVVQGVFLYRFQDEGSDPLDKEHHFGLVRPDGTAKPGLAAFRAAAQG